VQQSPDNALSTLSAKSASFVKNKNRDLPDLMTAFCLPVKKAPVSRQNVSKPDAAPMNWNSIIKKSKKCCAEPKVVPKYNMQTLN